MSLGELTWFQTSRNVFRFLHSSRAPARCAPSETGNAALSWTTVLRIIGPAKSRGHDNYHAILRTPRNCKPYVAAWISQDLSAPQLSVIARQMGVACGPAERIHASHCAAFPSCFLLPHARIFLAVGLIAPHSVRRGGDRSHNYFVFSQHDAP